jgi:hypothetical protein
VQVVMWASSRLLTFLDDMNNAAAVRIPPGMMTYVDASLLSGVNRDIAIGLFPT